MVKIQYSTEYFNFVIIITVVYNVGYVCILTGRIQKGEEKIAL